MNLPLRQNSPQMKLSAGSANIGGPLCLYDENGDAVAMLSDKRPDKELIALAIVKIINEAGGCPMIPLAQSN